MATPNPMQRGTDGYLTVPGAMRLLGHSRPKVLDLIIAGHLQAERIAGALVITRSSAEDYLSRSDSAAR